MFKTILIPTDGSELSQIAVANGVRLAKALGAKVVGLTVTAPYPYSALSEYIPETQAEYEKRVNVPATANLAAVEKTAGAAGVSCETLIKSHEHPYEAIIETAGERGCDVILMASHGRRGLSSILLGSETQKVLVHSKLPVIVFR